MYHNSVFFDTIIIFEFDYSNFSEFKNIVLPKDNKVTPDDKMKNNDILSILENGKTVEELMLITKKSREEILNTLVELECRGIIKNEVGIGYKKN